MITGPASALPPPLLRRLPSSPARSLEYVEGWGMSVGALSRVLRPRSVEEIVRCLELAHAERLPLALRGGGNSYGDASINDRGHVLDISSMDRVLAFDPDSGVVEAEGGVTIETLWKTILPHGWWPRVVSGTMYPTLAGAAAMNIHGKNNYAVGTIGDAIDAIDLVLPTGELVTCSRQDQADLFHAAIGGFGMLGVISRVVLRTKRVHSGDLWVRGISTRNLGEMLDYIEAQRSSADYLVGWIDCFPGGDASGRGLIHEAHYLEPGEDPEPERTLDLEHQEPAGQHPGPAAQVRGLAHPEPVQQRRGDAPGQPGQVHGRTLRGPQGPLPPVARRASPSCSTTCPTGSGPTVASRSSAA